MDSNGSLYATDGPVPPEDAARADEWLGELEAIVQRDMERMTLDRRMRDPHGLISITGTFS